MENLELGQLFGNYVHDNEGEEEEDEEWEKNPSNNKTNGKAIEYKNNEDEEEGTHRKMTLWRTFPHIICHDQYPQPQPQPTTSTSLGAVRLDREPSSLSLSSSSTSGPPGNNADEVVASFPAPLPSYSSPGLILADEAVVADQVVNYSSSSSSSSSSSPSSSFSSSSMSQPKHFPPSQQQKSLYRHVFLRRLFLCIFELFLLWLTSLRVISSVVNIFIPSPAFDFVGEECMFSYEGVIAQGELYSTCSRVQSRQCLESLDAAIDREITRVEQMDSRNFEKLSLLQNSSLAVYTEYNLHVKHLQAWLAVNPSVGVSYSHTCPSSNQSAVRNILGDSSSSTNDILSSSLLYTQSSDSRIERMAEYNIEQGQYTEEYLGAKLEGIEMSLEGVKNSTYLMLHEFLNVSSHDLRILMENTVNCLNMSSVAPCPYGASMSDFYSDLKYSMDVQKVAMENQIALYESQAKEYEEEVLSAINQANQFYEAVAGAQGLAQWVATNVPGIDLCEASGWCDFSKSSWSVSPLVTPDIMQMRSLPSAQTALLTYWIINQDASSTMKSTLNEITRAVNSTLRQSQQQSSQLTIQLENELTAVTLNTSDFHPPDYSYADSISEETVQQVASSEAYLSHLGRNVSSILASQRDNTIDAMNEAVADAVNRTSFDGTSLSVYDLLIGPWLTGHVDSDVFLQAIEAMQLFLYIFDIIYRVFQTLKIVQKHWSSVMASSPTIDIRAKEDLLTKIFCSSSKQSLLGSSSQFSSQINVAFQFVLYFWFYIVVLLAFISIALASIVYLYAPMYDSYIQNCVKQHQPSQIVVSARSLFSAISSSSSFVYDDVTKNSRTAEHFEAHFTSSEIINGTSDFVDDDGGGDGGTFLARNLKSMAYNYASMDGNAEITRSLTEYNAKSSNQCSSQFTSSSARYEGLLKIFKEAKFLYTDRLHQLEFLNNCVNSSKTSELFESVCGSSSSSSSYQEEDNIYTDDSLSSICPSEPYTHYPSTGRFDDKFSPFYYQSHSQLVLEESVFNCGALPTCAPSCSGPEIELIEASTSKCACLSEWMFHANVLQGLMVLLVYVLLNLSRSLSCKGIGLVYWKRLTIRQYEFVGTCRYTGETIDTGLLEEGGISSTDQRAIRGKIRELERGFVWKGIGLIMFGLLLNLPYAFCLLTIKSNIQYNPAS